MEVAEKSESQEICFVPDDDYAGFIDRHHAAILGRLGGEAGLPGDIVDEEGQVLGRHLGVHRFTVGQRRGLGVARGTPLYVIRIEPESRRVVVGTRGRLTRKAFRVERPNWVSQPSLENPLRVHAKIRSRHPEAPAVVEPAADGAVRVVFDEPQSAVTPGQACVFYRGETVVGGGWIARD